MELRTSGTCEFGRSFAVTALVLLLYVLCSALPLIQAQTDACSTNAIAASIVCPTDCSTAAPPTSGDPVELFLSGSLLLSANGGFDIVGVRIPGRDTAAKCCAACAAAGPSTCAIWNFYVDILAEGYNVDSPGICYFINEATCANIDHLDQGLGYSGRPPCPSVKQDPHCNVGGIKFDFHGIAGLWYAFLTDVGLQINAKLVGPNADCPEKMTWLEQIAVVWMDEAGKKRSLAIKIDQEKDWYGEDVLYFESDGQRVEAPVPDTNGDVSTIAVDPEIVWMAADGSASILRVANERNTSLLSIPDVIMLQISSAVDEWIQGSADPLGAYGKYLDMFIKYVRPLSPSVHGIIGQMLQANAYEDKMAIDTSNDENRERVDGDDDLYEVAGLADTQCHFCRFDEDIDGKASE